MKPYRITVAQYHKMIEMGILTSDDRVELLEGYLVARQPQTPPHASTNSRLCRSLSRLLPANWLLTCRGPITLDDSEPEPDITLARGREEIFDTRHPEPADIGVLMEVGDSTLMDDRRYKGELYAKAKIPEFWLVNLVERKVEVYTKPRGGKYPKKIEYTEKQSVPLVLDGVKIADIPVSELLAKT
ncbi:MAG: Uma2 family endonuclease [Planctomycetes bacterium]|nr:Uma2 family endonuclease [Planctomycetota bacterium]